MRLTAGQQFRAAHMPHSSTSVRDPFFTQKNCDRCGGDLSCRTMSWWTKEAICLECSKKEQPIKEALRAKGYTDALEGCGYIPDPASLPVKQAS